MDSDLVIVARKNKENTSDKETTS